MCLREAECRPFHSKQQRSLRARLRYSRGRRCSRTSTHDIPDPSAIGRVPRRAGRWHAARRRPQRSSAARGRRNPPRTARSDPGERISRPQSAASAADTTVCARHRSRRDGADVHARSLSGLLYASPDFRSSDSRRAPSPRPSPPEGGEGARAPCRVALRSFSSSHCGKFNTRRATMLRWISEEPP
jgi:hypothetical protein